MSDTDSNKGALADIDVSTSSDVQFHLRLYIAGKSASGAAAIRNLEAVCQAHLEGRYVIEVIDLLENPSLAKADQILAVPTLVRRLPLPVRKVIGDLSDTEKVLIGLDIFTRS